MTATPEDEHALIAAFANWLAVRPDGDRIRCALAEAFVEHRDELWPAGTDQGSPAWIAANVDVVLATIERLYAVAATGEHPGAAEFLDRLAWLPALLSTLDQGATLDG